MLHGFGASVYSWSRVMKPLAEVTGSKVIAFDRPAFGLTSRVDVSTHLSTHVPHHFLSRESTFSFVTLIIDFKRLNEMLILVSSLTDNGLPVLIITGDNDRIVPSWNAKGLSRAIPGSCLEVIKNCGILLIACMYLRS
uniref:AB hydrolase-1 domain-containing protein n=1 Tax=Populus trichocarpa TaxID=3694 RepID=B9N1Q4_POPTR